LSLQFNITSPENVSITVVLKSCDY